MSNFKTLNRISGWAAFAVAAIVYIMTMEPTASLWDCSEFIATSYKLEVGHPPGAPLFMMLARFFTIFAPSPDKAAMMVNLMSSLCGAFTVLFLCWSITHLARRIYQKDGKALTKGQTWAVLGAGIIGSLAYCFTDTQWFSAVEGEVYSMSSMFTALVFWAILQWEDVADQPHANRWLVLIAYLMGLSIGIHILNLLTIPALVFVYYFRKYPKVTTKGVILAALAAGAILVAVNYMIIPYSVSIGAFVDRVFVNSFGAPVNLGITVFAFAVFALCAWLIYYTYKNGKVVANTIILCVTVILLGYGSYASLVIRASANPPMNSNDPSNPYALLSLLNRDQYGDRPLLYGPYYTSPAESLKYSTTYYLNEKGDKYLKTENPVGTQYADGYMYFFPRMYAPVHAKNYQNWVDIKGRREVIDGEVMMVPTFAENMKYFFNYQMNFMYWRYFLWNFVGRQSDAQSTGQITDGNWLSGIKLIDEIYLGPQDNLPSDMASNKGRNTYFFLPFLLGVAGLIYQLLRDKRNFTVVLLLFVMMGIALVVYFNTGPSEPRERDYVYAGSFYAFCIWIGLGVLWLRDLIVRATRKDTLGAAIGATVVCAVVPGILVAQNWDDHDRSNRYIARDVGFNYLNSTLPNSIVINFGDNDTFPLWYNQEVEGVRLDAKVMNHSYLSADWYIDQMRIRSNDAPPVPFSLPRSKYINHNNESILVLPYVERANIKDAINFVKSDDRRTKEMLTSGRLVDYIPSKTLLLPVNKENVIASGIVKPEDAHLIEDTVVINITPEILLRNDLMLLDMLATFDWKRPIYFTQAMSLNSLGLQDYLQFDGAAYRLVPIRTTARDFGTGRVDPEYLYPKLMEEFRWGNVKDPRVDADYFTRYTLSSSQARNAFARLAKALVEKGDTVRALNVLERALEELPTEQVGYSYPNMVPVIEAYYVAGAFDKGTELLADYARLCREYIDYFMGFPAAKEKLVQDDLQNNIAILYSLYMMAEKYGQKEKADEIKAYFVSVGL